MTSDELARSMLADLDDRHPGRCAGSLAGLTIAEAYSLQQAVSTLREQRGEKVVGYKIGCTSGVIQDQLGIREPIFARVFDSGCFRFGSELCHARFACPAVEGELALRLSRDLPCGPAADEAYAQAIESVFPVIELHHYVLPSHTNPLIGLIASGGMHAGLVLPDGETVCSGGVPAVDELRVVINNQLAGVTGAPWTMGEPVATLRWLRTRLAKWGLALQRGQVILTGSALPLFPVDPGSRITVEARTLGRSSATID